MVVVYMYGWRDYPSLDSVRLGVLASFNGRLVSSSNPVSLYPSLSSMVNKTNKEEKGEKQNPRTKPYEGIAGGILSRRRGASLLKI